MARRFLPALRSKQLLTPVLSGPDGVADEVKVVLANYFNTLASAGVWSPHRTQPWPVERAVAEGYERIVWVFKAVEAISGNAARLPYRLKEDERVVDDHPLYRVLNKKANPMETGRQFRKRLCAQVLLSKQGAFVELTRSRSGDIVRMDLLPPGRTRPVPGEQALIDHYEVVRADGSRNQIPAENVRWFRDPHPIDPYSGTTPLESAGMSVELDFFARLYNVSFLKNDGRPAGALGIDGEMDPDEMDRVEARFGGGPIEAGKLAVINGKLTYIDLAARPRDMAYEVLSANTKIEILTAFGVPESVIGYSADRTYANAEQELYNFWTVTMPPVLDLLATGLDEDSEDDLDGEFDTSKVEVLQRAENARRSEARDEFDLGLISPDEYRERAGYDRIDRPETRALYIASGKQPLPASDDDAEEMGLGRDQTEEQPQPAPLGGGQEVEPPPGETGAPTSPGAGAEESAGSPAVGRRAGPAPGQSKRLQAVAGGNVPAVTASPVMRLVRTRETKTAAAARQYADSDADEDARDAVEAAVEAALVTVTDRLVQRTLARLESPKNRKGTRHWEADPEMPADTRIGNKALDTSRIVDEERWATEAEDATRPLLTAAAAAAAAGLLADLGVLDAQRTVTARLAEVHGDVVRLIGRSLRDQAERIAALINAADQEGRPLAQIVDAVRARARRLAGWARGVAAQAATAVTSGAREIAAQSVAADDQVVDVARQWRTRKDDKVRATHAAAHGQNQPVGSPFVVGSALLRFPGDPLGPPSETHNCRCVLNYRSRRSGRYVSRPASELVAGVP